jgi:hypothetical protein
VTCAQGDLRLLQARAAELSKREVDVAASQSKLEAAAAAVNRERHALARERVQLQVTLYCWCGSSQTDSSMNCLCWGVAHQDCLWCFRPQSCPVDSGPHGGSDSCSVGLGASARDLLLWREEIV